MSTHRLTPAPRGPRGASRRPGSVSAYLLLALPMLLVAVAIGVHSAMLVQGTQEMQNAADAAALAAARVLVDDDILLAGRADGFPQAGSRAAVLPLLERAREEALRFAGANRVLGEKLDLDANADNDRHGDIVFASLEKPRDRNLVVADVTDPKNTSLHLINTVRIRLEATAERGQPLTAFSGPLFAWTTTDVTRAATATLDRDVIGFRPILGKPLELVPVALLADTTGSTPESWHYQVETGNGKDEWRFDRVTKQASKDGPDGIREMTAVLLTSSKSDGGKEDRGNACLLQVGGAGVETLERQITEGVAREDLADLAGEFVLGMDNTLKIPASPTGPGAGTTETERLKASLEQVQQLGEPRVWPLYSGFDPVEGKAVLMGFVAARVLSVGTTEQGSLTFVLQPASIATAHAVTDVTRRGVNGITIYSPYICKVRLVE